VLALAVLSETHCIFVRARTNIAIFVRARTNIALDIRTAYGT